MVLTYKEAHSIIISFSRREKMLKLREKLISAEEERLMGKKEYSIDELENMLEDAVAEANHSE